MFLCFPSEKQAVWALGNVAGDSPKCRDFVLSFGAMLPLLSQFNKHAKLSMLRNATWTLSNFCRGKPQPSFEQVSFKMKPSFVVFVIYFNMFLYGFFPSRQAKLYQFLRALCNQQMKKFSLMHAGLWHTSRITQMKLYRRLSMQALSLASSSS